MKKLISHLKLATLTFFISMGTFASTEVKNIACNIIDAGAQSMLISIEKQERGYFIEAKTILGDSQISKHSFTSKKINLNELKFEAKGESYGLKIDFTSTEGKLKFSRLGSTCFPGNSEWCVGRIPTWESFNYQLKDCRITQ